MTKIVIIGASSAIATEVARQYAAIDHPEFILVGRNQLLLDTLQKDLVVRGAKNGSRYIETPLDQASMVTDVVIDASIERMPDVVLIAQGSLGSQPGSEAAPSIASEELYINAISPVLWAESFAQMMGPNHDGVIAVIGSVAGDRGRKSNYVYGSAKALVDTYVRGMQHRLHNSKLRVLLIKPGPVSTPMTSHLDAKSSSLATTQQVAMEIRKAIKIKSLIVYTPKKWSIIMFLIRNLPSSIFNRINI